MDVNTGVALWYFCVLPCTRFILNTSNALIFHEQKRSPTASADLGFALQVRWRHFRAPSHNRKRASRHFQMRISTVHSFSSFRFQHFC